METFIAWCFIIFCIFNFKRIVIGITNDIEDFYKWRDEQFIKRLDEFHKSKEKDKREN
jgi:hypothetical protein